MWKIILFLRTKAYFFLLFLGITLLLSCQKPKEVGVAGKQNQVARVDNAILYEEDVAQVVKKETGADSIVLRERFINNWIRKELLLKTARMNLSEQEQDIEDRVKDYRASLLINQYKQKYLAEHLDTLVTEEEVAMYIKEYPDNFVLQENLYKYYSAKILKKNTDDIKFVKRLFSKREVNLMQDFDLKSSTLIGSYDIEWYTERELLANLPEDIIKSDLKQLREGKIFETKDSLSVYLLRPLQIIKKGQMSPQEYVNGKVREIILHNRKIELAKKLEYEIYEDAKTKNQFEVY